jgi:hypothetical protein
MFLEKLNNQLGMKNNILSEAHKKNVQTTFWAMGIVFVIGLIFYFFDKKKEPISEEKPDYNPKDLI